MQADGEEHLLVLHHRREDLCVQVTRALERNMLRHSVTIKKDNKVNAFFKILSRPNIICFYESGLHFPQKRFPGEGGGND